jgi:hypothetical protein
MKKFILVINIIVNTINVCFSQNKNNFIGVWQEFLQDSNCYCLITDTFYYWLYHNEEYFSLDIWHYGFIDNKFDSLSVSQFKDFGKYFVLADVNLEKNRMYDESCFLIYGTDVHSKYADFTAIELEGPKVFMYTKIFKFNKKLEENLKEKSPDVFVEYLKVTSQLEIYSKKCTVYSEPDRPTKAQLQKGDIVMIIEEQDNWLKIAYGDENDIGWIKRKDVKYNNNFIKRDK